MIVTRKPGSDVTKHIYTTITYTSTKSLHRHHQVKTTPTSILNSLSCSTEKDCMTPSRRQTYWGTWPAISSATISASIPRSGIRAATISRRAMQPSQWDWSWNSLRMKHRGWSHCSTKPGNLRVESVYTCLWTTALVLQKKSYVTDESQWWALPLLREINNCFFSQTPTKCYWISLSLSLVSFQSFRQPHQRTFMLNTTSFFWNVGEKISGIIQ